MWIYPCKWPSLSSGTDFVKSIGLEDIRSCFLAWETAAARALGVGKWSVVNGLLCSLVAYCDLSHTILHIIAYVSEFSYLI